MNHRQRRARARKLRRRAARLVLRIFGDETASSQSGIPLADDDGPFGISMVAVMGDTGTDRLPLGRARRPEDVVRLLQDIRGFPSWSYVLPVPGYGRARAEKHRAVNVLGLEQKRTTGRNARYIPDEGVNARNSVWGYAMGAALATMVPFAILRNRATPTHVEIYLDEKTLQSEHREMLRRTARKFSETVRAALREGAIHLPAEQARLARALAEKVNVPAEHVTVKWSDERGFKASEREMQLVDSLASHCRRELEGKGAISGALREVYNTFRMTDITHVLMEPISRDAIRRWERRTGLSAAKVLAEGPAETQTRPKKK